MIYWFKKYGDKAQMEHVQEWPHVKLSASHTHIECCGYRIPGAVRLTCL